MLVKNWTILKLAYSVQYKSNGTFVGCDVSRKFFAKVTMENDLIKKVA